MPKGALFLLLAVITSVASAEGAEPSDPLLAAQNADLAMEKCFYKQAAALDDRVSDASTIARAAVSMCYVEVDEWKFTSFQELRPPSAAMLYERMDKMALDFAIETVLKVRAASKH